MCTHAFHDSDLKQAFEDASVGMIDRQTFELLKGEKADILDHCPGNDDFSFAICLRKMRAQQSNN